MMQGHERTNWARLKKPGDHPRNCKAPGTAGSPQERRARTLVILRSSFEECEHHFIFMQIPLSDLPSISVCEDARRYEPNEDDAFLSHSPVARITRLIS